MNNFRFATASNSAGAISALASEPLGRFLAGGTTLIDLMKLHVEQPEALVDINPLPFTAIEHEKAGLRVGAMVRNSDLAYHQAVKSQFPVLSEALLSGASPQLRNMATVGGNLLQRTRCVYFRDHDLPCNKRDPGTGCGAMNGFNRFHAILGTSEHCIATHASDMCVALVALDAVVHFEGRSGARAVPLGQFYFLPGDTPERENVLAHEDLITAVEIPALPFAHRSHYLKTRDRASYEFALASAAVAVDVEGGKIRQSRVALGGVGTVPWRSSEAEAKLNGAPANTETYKQAADAALEGARPRTGNAFKVQLAKETLIRALEEVEAIA